MDKLASTPSTATSADRAVTRVVEKAPHWRPPSFCYVVIPPYRLAVEFFPVEKYVIVEVPKLIERSGKGKHTFANGDAEEGEYKDGKMNGKGKRSFANGTIYKGEFKDGRRTRLSLRRRRRTSGSRLQQLPRGKRVKAWATARRRLRAAATSRWDWRHVDLPRHLASLQTLAV